MPGRSEWISRGREAIIDLLAEQLAAPVIEIEARISDRAWRDQPRYIDPHLLTEARHDLIAAGLVLRVQQVTRGGSKIALLQPSPIPRGKTRAAEDAAARKRLLVARWRGWSRASESMPNLIGNGGEAVVHHSLRAAAPYGYRLVQPTRGQVGTLYGDPVPGGALDNAAWLTPMDQQTQAPAGGPVLVPIEVKNLRHWLYPHHWEIYQLLHKAAGLAIAHPEYPVLPILICRKVHYRTHQLARDLGFLIFQTHSQYVQPSERVRPDHFEEVREELGLADLQLTDSANPALVGWLAGAPAREGPAYSDRWMEFSRHLLPTFGQLREQALPWPNRLEIMGQLHRLVIGHFGQAGSWSQS